MNDVLTGTPAELTYMHPIVVQAWTAVWAVASGALVVIIGWIGLSLIVSEHLGRPQAGWRELVPRLVLGLVAAASSLWWCALVIDTADAVTGFIAAELGFTAGDLLRASKETLLTAVSAGSVGMALLIGLLYLVYGFFVLYVLVQMLLRIALIDLLLALAPIALGLWILPHTAGWGRHWLRLFMTAVFQQAVQIVALSMGFTMLNEFAAIGSFEPTQDLVWKLILSAAFVYLATRVPSMLGNAGTFDAWLHTLYFGLSLPGTAMRATRSIGPMLAGPGGIAAGAAVASGAASVVGGIGGVSAGAMPGGSAAGASAAAGSAGSAASAAGATSAGAASGMGAARSAADAGTPPNAGGTASPRSSSE
ncbi:MAG: type IV secretion system protein [Chloroflexota bacterium]|nr:type IV secretion system protein [Chloroflexota bacterium]